MDHDPAEGLWYRNPNQKALSYSGIQRIAVFPVPDDNAAHAACSFRSCIDKALSEPGGFCRSRIDIDKKMSKMI
jgi:hypothetical protein